MNGESGVAMVRTTAVAEHFGVSDRTVRRWCVAGTSPGRKVGKLWFLHPAWLAEVTAWTPTDGEAA